MWFLLKKSPIEHLWKPIVSVSVASFYGASGGILHSPRLWLFHILQKLRLYIIGRCIRDKKVQKNYIGLKVGTFKPKFDKIYFRYQYRQSLYDCMQK